MHRISITLAVLVCSLASTAHLAEAKTKKSKSDYTVSIDSKVMNSTDKAEVSAWTAYGLARVESLMARDSAVKKTANNSGDDFEVELAGRIALVAESAAQSEGSSNPKTPYFAMLGEISGATFLDEYVVAAFARPGWTIPKSYVSAFDFPGFWEWVEKNPLGNEHPTGAFTETSSGKMWPDTPGATLLDPSTLKMDKASCAATAKSALPELKRWEQEAQRLAGEPLAADTRNEFAYSVAEIAGRGAAPANGLTWVSSRPAVLAYMAGYCFVELGDIRSAQAALTTATKMRPRWVRAQLELTQVLILQQKLPDADKIVDYALTMTSDRCELAHIYRKRGYIRFDQGRLEESRDAYRKSLEYEPGNKIALSELKLLEQEREKKGMMEEPYTPPPAGDLQATKCQL